MTTATAIPSVDRLAPTIAGVNRDVLAQVMQHEQQVFVHNNPRSHAAAQHATAHLLFGVPLHWMTDWPAPFTLQVNQAQGAHLVDADGHALIDFCLGDTGAMFGHAPAPVVKALADQATRGYTTMLSNEDGPAVAALLAQRFGLPQWQFAMTASDANRFMLRWVRAATGRPVVLVFNGCYHGTVDDTLMDLENGQTVQRPSLLGQVHDLSATTRVVQFNDLKALEQALQPGDVACVLAEPVMTNIGMVMPDVGFWEEAQALIHRYGSLLVMDETHTISTGPGGYAMTHGVQVDGLVVGKPLGGGMPCAAYGMSADLSARAQAAKRAAPPGHSGIGTTLTANGLAMAAMRATLTELLTPATYAPMLAGAQQLATGLKNIITKYELPWCVTQVGARTEFQFCPHPPRHAVQAEQAMVPELEQALHLYLLNRGVLITPFHNMMLVSPVTTSADIEKLLLAFEGFVGQLVSKARQ